MKYISRLLKAIIFFTLFAFAINNQQTVTLHFFFGAQWHTSLVLVVLAAFTVGLMLGILAMVPRWWRSRKEPEKHIKNKQNPEAQTDLNSGNASASAPALSGSLPNGL